MNIAAVMPARNEDWVLGLSARAALEWCDRLIILNHASQDLTAAIIAELSTQYPGRITALHVDYPTWDEMEHRQLLLEWARLAGATHIAIIDADEILTGNLLGVIRSTVGHLLKGCILQLPGYNLRGGINSYHANGIWGERWFSVVFCEDARLYWRGDRFHHREPMGLTLNPWQPIGQRSGGIMHLWGASERRLVAKHAAYKMIETLRWPAKSRAEIDQIYSQAFDPAANREFAQSWRYADVPPDWWQPYADLMRHLRTDAEPWQEKYCRELYTQYGAERFSGLHLYGVCEESVCTQAV